MIESKDFKLQNNTNTTNIIASNNKSAVKRLFVLDLSGGCIISLNPDDTSEIKTIVTDCHHPDDIVVDVESRHIYWTNMGIPDKNDGSI